MTSWLADQLPSYLVEDRLFVDFLAVFTALADETRVHGDALAYLADLDVTSGPMLRYMGQWLAFGEIDPGLPDHRQRQLLRRLGSIVMWRGTRRGLTELLTLLTEDDVSISVGAGPDSAAGGSAAGGSAVADSAAVAGLGLAAKVVTVDVRNTAWLTRQQFAALVRNEIPADCTLRLSVKGRPLTTTETKPRRRVHDDA